jgi:hypothetical protein
MPDFERDNLGEHKFNGEYYWIGSWKKNSFDCVKCAEFAKDGTQRLVFLFMIMNVWVVWKEITEPNLKLWQPGSRSLYSDWLRAGPSEGSEFEFRRVKISLFSTSTRPDLGLIPPPMGTGGYFPGG